MPLRPSQGDSFGASHQGHSLFDTFKHTGIINYFFHKTLNNVKMKLFQFCLKSVILPGIIALSACNRPLDRENVAGPNVLFISIDDLRPELGCYGNTEIKTPNIDRLAGNGVVFTKAYCQVAVCAPSRASIMTGLRPDSNHVWHLGDKFREILPDVVTIPQYFHKYGYYTVSMGKIFHNYMPDSVSWDEPDLRPPKYKTKAMVDRDPETFYHDPAIIEAQTLRRNKIIKKNPHPYANGWNCGPAYEISDAPDSAFYDWAQTDLAISTLKRLKKKKQPFFLAVGYYRPHLPFVVPEKYWDLYNRDSISLAPDPYLPENMPVMAMNSMYELRGYMGFGYIKHPAEFSFPADTARLLKHGYYASVSYIDACVGRLLQELKQTGLDKNTIVVLWGDHGWKLGEHNSWCKMTNYDIDTHIPVIFKPPDAELQGKRCDRLVEAVDIFPTLCELSGIDIPAYLQGTSVVPLMHNPDLQWKDAVFSQFHRRPRVSPDKKRYMGYSMTTRRYHYVEWYYWDNVKKEHGDLSAIELYDHSVDPGENINIASDPGNRELIQKLSVQLEKGWKAARPDQGK